MTDYLKRIRPQQLGDAAIFGIGILLVLRLRQILLPFVSGDMTYFTGIWYTAIKEQGFSFFRTDLSNYTPPYLYMLYLVSVFLPGLSTPTAIKLPSIIFDLVCAWYVYRIVRLRYESGPLPFFAFFAVLLAPPVVLNSAVWGQADSIYTAMLVACIYYLMVHKDWQASLAFGAAFAIKFQAIFLAPLLLVLALKRFLSWKSLLLIPLVYLVAILPAWIAGRPFMELLTIYQSQSEIGRGMTFGAPNLYNWLPMKYLPLFFPAGLIWTAGASLLYVVAVLKSKIELIPSLLIRLGLLSLMMLPYFLPKMHERYFFPTDVLSIAYGFYFPRYYLIPVALNLVSFFSYEKFLFDRVTFKLVYLALVMLVLLVVVAKHTFTGLYEDQKLAEV
jgi:Gpi18-like mannosyltransferase